MLKGIIPKLRQADSDGDFDCKEWGLFSHQKSPIFQWFGPNNALLTAYIFQRTNVYFTLQEGEW